MSEHLQRPAEKIPFEAGFLFREFDSWAEDRELTSRLTECIELQKKIEPVLLKTRFQPDEQASRKVSPEALARILERDRDVTSIGAKDRQIANCIVFGTRDVGGIRNDQVRRLMRRVDRIVASKAKELFRSDRAIWTDRIGHFWYPPGGYMGWHTNSNAPGWRMYVTCCDEPGKSFFRYRDPKSREIVTSYDRRWTVRLFKVSSGDLMWHSIYSDTNRYSFGYRIVERPSLSHRIGNKLGRVLKDVRSGRLPRWREV
jgi:hypothetical protein